MSYIDEELAAAKRQIDELQLELAHERRQVAILRNVLTLPNALGPDLLRTGAIADPDLRHWFELLPEVVASLPPLVRSKAVPA